MLCSEFSFDQNLINDSEYNIKIAGVLEPAYSPSQLDVKAGALFKPGNSWSDKRKCKKSLVHVCATRYLCVYLCMYVCVVYVVVLIHLSVVVFVYVWACTPMCVCCNTENNTINLFWTLTAIDQQFLIKCLAAQSSGSSCVQLNVVANS